jgi:uncharacterized protein (TIGR02996 family)
MRTFELSTETGRTFWTIDVRGASITVAFGKVGTAGQTRTKTVEDATRAHAEADKLIREKTRKGYTETIRKAAPEEAAFEKALVENPDDLAGWCAFADYLVEQGDPRGEFMRVQIALEDENRKKKEREALKEKERALLAEHERAWLGGLARFALDEEREGQNYWYSTRLECGWRRGVLSRLVVGQLTLALAQALASDPAARFVTELQVGGQCFGHRDEGAPRQPRPSVPTPSGVTHHMELFELIGSALFANLRAFQLGDQVPEEDGWCDCITYARGIEYVAAAMPRVEVLNLYCKEYESEPLFRLTNLTHLRELRIYHLGGKQYGRRYEYALDVLAKNPAFSNLTHLLFHPHHVEKHTDDGSGFSYLPLEQVKALVRSPHLKKLTHLQIRLSDMGDGGVREIIASGILKRLKWLDLRHGGITNVGANLLAVCPDAKRLERIDLSRNGVTSTGLRALRKAGVNAVANQPLTDGELINQMYLAEGDQE